MADNTQEPQHDVLAKMASGKQMTQREVTRLMDTIQVLSSAMSNMLGTYMTASDHWRAHVDTGEIEYDLGLAAALDREAQIGISGHEIAHLRFSSGAKYRRVKSERDRKWAHDLTNMLEDRRVELLMVADFPGLAAPIERLRKAFDAPLVERAMGMAEPHVQFLGAIYGTAFERPFTVTNPEAEKAIAEFRGEIEELVHARSSQQVATAVEREGGMLERLFALRDLPSQDAAKQDPKQVRRLPKPPKDAAPGQDQMGAPDPDDDAALAAAMAALEGGSGAGSDSGASNEGQKPEPGGDSAPGSDGQGGENAPGSGDGAPGDAGAREWAPTQDDLASLPDGHADVLKAIVDSAEAMADARQVGRGGSQGGTVPGGRSQPQELEHARADAELLARQLSGMRAMIGDVRRQVTAARDADETGVDDDRMELVTDDDRYDRILESVHVEASVLTRRLGQVLAENRADRLASVTYRSGQRLSMPGLMQAVADPNHDLVYRRRGRSKNRRYAFALLGDCSGSMRGEKLSQMAYTAILASKAIEDVDGCDIAVYGFASDVAVLKPFGISLEIRGGYLGAFGKQTKLGGSTNMGTAIHRAGADMLARYDESWRRVIMVVTDGQPSRNDRHDVEKVIRSLIRHDDFEFFGIGIQTQGRLAQIFPHWIALADAWELTPALMRMMSKAVVRG
jgi:uncharacterized protein YegL